MKQATNFLHILKPVASMLWQPWTGPPNILQRIANWAAKQIYRLICSFCSHRSECSSTISLICLLTNAIAHATDLPPKWRVNPPMANPYTADQRYWMKHITIYHANDNKAREEKEGKALITESSNSWQIKPMGQTQKKCNKNGVCITLVGKHAD